MRTHSFDSNHGMTFGQASMYQDQCKRVSTCALCEQSIFKGERRIVFSSSHQPRKNRGKNGGTIFRSRNFMHPACLAGWVGEGVPNRNDSCHECGESLLGTISRQRYMGYLHKRSYPVRICEPCISSGKWRLCRSCNYHVRRYQASEIVDDTIPAGHFYCDLCAEESDFMTIKKRKRLNREARNAAGQADQPQ